MLYEAAPPNVQRKARESWPHLATLLPNQMQARPKVTGEARDEQVQVFQAVTAFLHAVAEHRPVGLLLDDIHWADSGSLSLLLYIIRHSRSAPVCIIATYRDVEIGRHHPLGAALTDLRREGLLERITVRRLEQEGTSRLIAATIGEESVYGEFATLVHRATEGNPYFVQQVLRELVERGDIFRSEAGVWETRKIEDIEVPESIRSVIGYRLSRLSGDIQEILQEASILGSGFWFEDLLAMTSREETALERALEEAGRSGLVREVGDDRFSYDHALTQQVLVAELSSRRKRRLHLAAGEGLDRLARLKPANRAAEIAWHFLEADVPGQALPYELQAGDDAEAAFAHAEA